MGDLITHYIMNYIILKEDIEFDLFANSKKNENIFSKLFTVPFVNCYRFHSVFEDDYFLHGLCETKSDQYSLTRFCNIHSFYSRYGMTITKIEFDLSLTETTKLGKISCPKFYIHDTTPDQYPNSLEGIYERNLEMVSITLPKDTKIRIDYSDISLGKDTGIGWEIVEHKNIKLDGTRFFTPLDNLLRLKSLSSKFLFLSLYLNKNILPKYKGRICPKKKQLREL